MSITAAQVNELRQMTGVGMMTCKNALVEAEGDMKKAIEILKKSGEAKAAKRSDREVNEGAIAAYVHQNNKIATLVELRCETDFVARNEDFLDVAKKIAMQVAAMDPKYINVEDVNEEDIEKEKVVWKEQLLEEGKPEEVIEKIITGKVEKYNSENVLVKQKFFMDDSKTIEQLLVELTAKCGEKVTLGKVSRLAV